MEEDLNLSSEELLEQIFVYLNDIDWEEDQIDEILGQISEIEEELELEDNLIPLPNFPYINEYSNDYKYPIIYESPKYILLQDIPNQLYDYLEQIELFPFQGYSTTFQELEYNYHTRYKSQVQKIKEQQNQLIKNLILSNQINNPILNNIWNSQNKEGSSPIIILNPNNLRTKGLQNTTQPQT